jgi:hypothetical protein
MDFEDALRAAAHRADQAAWEAMQAYADGTVDYEPSITGGLATGLRTALNRRISSLTWTAHVMKTGRGVGSEENPTGADLLIHVRLATPTISYSKGVLVQAKRVESGEIMDRSRYEELVGQCHQMLNITAASFVFDYAKAGMRCISASSIVDSNLRNLHEQCPWTPYRFFLELFRCPVGDPSITSAQVSDLPIPNKLELKASSEPRTPVTEPVPVAPTQS